MFGESYLDRPIRPTFRQTWTRQTFDMRDSVTKDHPPLNPTRQVALEIPKSVHLPYFNTFNTGSHLSPRY